MLASSPSDAPREGVSPACSAGTAGGTMIVSACIETCAAVAALRLVHQARGPIPDVLGWRRDMTDPRRSQAIQAVINVLASVEAVALRTEDGSPLVGITDWTVAESIVDAVLAVPPAEPQEGDRRWSIFVCSRCGLQDPADCGREIDCGYSAGEEVEVMEVPRAPVQSSPDPVRAAAKAVADFCGDDGYPGTSSHAYDEFCPLILALRAALGSVREPGPNVTRQDIDEVHNALISLQRRVYVQRAIEAFDRLVPALEAALEGER